MQGCTCVCACHVHTAGHCRNSALPGAPWCFGCISEHACDHDRDRREAARAREAEKEAAKVAAA
jgi:hypothetical protein